MKILVQVLRIFVGVVFIISGLVKTIDPIGFSYKLEEYFSESVLNLPFLHDYALLLSTIFVIFEVMLGVLLLMGSLRNFTLVSLLILIVFFTFLTFYSAYFNKVTDCGCFGDALKLTPWQSFAKDVVLLVLIVILWFKRKFISPLFAEKPSFFVILFSFAFCAFVAYKGIYELPLIDFRPFAVGKNLIEGRKSAEELGLKPPKYGVLYTLEHQKTKEQKQVNDSIYIADKIYEDTLWVIKSSESYKKSDGYEPPISPDFVMQCGEKDKTDELLKSDFAVFITILYPNSIEAEDWIKIKSLVNELQKEKITFAVLAPEVIQQVPCCTMDLKVLKTINRSKFGVFVTKKGTVASKFHMNNFPTLKELKITN